MLEKVKERLKALGYEATDNDSVALTFALNKSGGAIKSLCNLYEIPEELEHVLIERACGEFLLVLNQTNRLSESFSVESAIKSVKLGDADISFVEGKSQEQKISTLINHLLNQGSEELICYRKLRW